MHPATLLAVSEGWSGSGRLPIASQTVLYDVSSGLGYSYCLPILLPTSINLRGGYLILVGYSVIFYRLTKFFYKKIHSPAFIPVS